MPRLVPSGLGAAAVLFVLATLIPLRSASGDSGPWREFYPTGEYVLFVGDQLDENAVIHHSERAAAYLVTSDRLERAVLILPRTRCVEAIAADEMEAREDGGIDIKKRAMPCSLGRFRIEGSNIIFRIGSETASLRQKPPLEGGHLREGVLRHSPQYERQADVYEPDPAMIEAIKRGGKQARIQIFFGSWCSFCKRFIPYVLKVEEQLEDTELSFEYFGLPAPPAAWSSDMATQMGIKKLPTGIIFIDDREVGRVIGTEWVTPERALARILQ